MAQVGCFVRARLGESVRARFGGAWSARGSGQALAGAMVAAECSDLQRRLEAGSEVLGYAGPRDRAVDLDRLGPDSISCSPAMCGVPDRVPSWAASTSARSKVTARRRLPGPDTVLASAGIPDPIGGGTFEMFAARGSSTVDVCPEICGEPGIREEFCCRAIYACT